jgi:hypothetical protein
VTVATLIPKKVTFAKASVFHADIDGAPSAAGLMANAIGMTKLMASVELENLDEQEKEE